MKQETLEEAAERYANHEIKDRGNANDKLICSIDFIEGAKWQAEQGQNKYSKEEVESIWKFALYSAEQHDKFGNRNKSYFIRKDVEEFIEEFKKK